MRKLEKYIITSILSASLTLSTLSGCGFIENTDFYTSYKDTSIADLVENELSQTVTEDEVKKLADAFAEQLRKHNGRAEGTLNTTEKDVQADIPETETINSCSTPQEMTEYIRLHMPVLPAYSGTIYEVINDNEPFFIGEDFSTISFEYYPDMDEKGRCMTCVANIGYDLMPTEERGPIGYVKPSGWNQNKYPGLVEGNYLYNRCHLIGYQLTGENANENNLITGTRVMNTEGMLPFENMVADYIRETKNHVLYRITPVFEDDNLLAAGVLMEAKSVEDNGAGITFCVFVYNIQDGIEIDYTDGSNRLKE